MAHIDLAMAVNYKKTVFLPILMDFFIDVDVNVN
jgi:hypothetical protein